MTGGSTIVKIFAFININLILWSLTAYQYGAVELTLSIVSFGSLLLFSGLSGTVVADMVSHRERQEPGVARSIFIRFLFLSAAGGVLGFLGLTLFSLFLGTFEGKKETQLFLQIASFGILITPVRMAIQNVFTVFSAFDTLTKFTMIEELAKTAAIVALVTVLEWGALGLIVATVIAQIAPILIFAPRAYSLLGTIKKDRAQSYNPLLLFQEHRVWSLASGTLGFATKPVRIWLIKLFLGTEAVGLFALAFGVFGHVSGIVTLSSVFAPVVAKYAHQKETLKKLVHAATKYQVLLSTAACIACIPVLAIAIPIVYPHFISALPITYWLLVGVIPTGVLGLCTPIFIALKEQRSQFVSGIFKTLATVVFAIVLYPLFGITGIGIELLITLLVSLWERDRRLKLLLGTHLFDFMNFFRFTDEDRMLVAAITNKTHTLVSKMIRAIFGSLLTRS